MSLSCHRCLIRWAVTICLASMATMVDAIYRGHPINSSSQFSKYSFVVSISYHYFNETDKSTHFSNCAGTIIDEYWIVTAASCVRAGEKPVLELFIDYGADGGLTTKSRKIYSEKTKSFQYPSFARVEGDLFKDDIALIKLPREHKIDLKGGGAVQSIKMPDSAGFENGFINDLCTIAGFGADSMRPGRNQLLVGDIRLISNSNCQSPLKNTNAPFLCATPTVNPQYPCQFDTGGPLACKNRIGVYYLTGIIASVATPCSQSPSVVSFTPVSHYLHWMADVSHFENSVIKSLAKMTSLSRYNNALDFSAASIVPLLKHLRSLEPSLNLAHRISEAKAERRKYRMGQVASENSSQSALDIQATEVSLGDLRNRALVVSENATYDTDSTDTQDNVTAITTQNATETVSDTPSTEETSEEVSSSAPPTIEPYETVPQEQ